MKSREGFSKLETETPNIFYTHSLATVWEISIQRLSSASTMLLSILSCLDPDGVPEAMIRQGTKESVELAFLSSAKAYSDAASELLRNGLVWKRNKQVPAGDTGQPKKQPRGLSLHRLVANAAFLQQNAEERQKTISKAVQVGLNVFPHPTRTNFRLMHRWAECEAALPQLLALESRCDSTPDLVLDIQLAELFLYAGWYLYERRAPEVAIPLLNRARKVVEDENNGADWFLKSRILSAFGFVLFECSRYAESEHYFREALAIRLDNAPSDDILLAHSYQDTALPVSGQVRYQEAIDLQTKALEIVEQSQDDFTRRDMMFHIHHNMARTYEAAGNAEEALKLHLHQGDEFGNGLRLEMSESGAVNLYSIGNCHLALGNQERGIHYHSRGAQNSLAVGR
jgi:tetratricopeptide (TPR) repeat protein